ncbi:hypothetical protein DPMN_050037 [Dreissena polymorpha]|uniref:Uncharacterized protein n=1 Tax=Dreissena polymorpha TaxID=45954 RepID=A0A9D4CGP0_DREPO|nr:hypothetical protein DPMN_050037 [Dreissena polymorpha]
MHDRKLIDAFEVSTGERQGCLLAFPVSAGHRLDHGDLDGSEAKRDPVDILETVGRPRLCR